MKFVKFDLSKKDSFFSRKYYMKRFGIDLFFFFDKNEEIYLSANCDEELNLEQKESILKEIKEAILSNLKHYEY